MDGVCCAGLALGSVPHQEPLHGVLLRSRLKGPTPTESSPLPGGKALSSTSKDRTAWETQPFAPRPEVGDTPVLLYIRRR